MIRLNPGTTKRRQHSNNNGNNSSSSNHNQQAADGGNDEGTHDDMYDGTSSKVNRLFEELLGDNASAIGSVNNNTVGEESTTMSSVLGPILRANNSTKNNGLENIPEEKKGNGGRGGGNNNGVLNVNSSNNAMLNQLSKRRNQQQPQQQQAQQQQQQQQQQEDDQNDEDTYMTKPREIMLDQNSDDISLLFGGHGGASLSGFRQRGHNNAGGGGMGKMFGRKKPNGRHPVDEDSRRTGGTSTFRSHGVNSILEEIGLRPKSDKKRESLNDGDDDDGDDFLLQEENNKGHNVTRYADRNTRTSGGRDRGLRHHAGSQRNSSTKKQHYEPTSLFDQLRNIKSKHLTILLIGVMFVTIQFTTLQKRDKATMDHINWRFQNHRYASAQDRSREGLSAGIQQIAMDNVEGNYMNSQRRRGGVYDSNNNEDGLGDVLRKTVPLVKHREWEQDQIMLDDGFTNNNEVSSNNVNNLRGGGNTAQEMGLRNENDVLQQRKLELQAQVEHEQVRQQVHQQQQQQVQQQQQIHQPQQQQGNNRMMNNNNQQQDQNMEHMGNTHPLLKPQTGLSMADALDKLSPHKLGSTDKLSDIDPRPHQQLTNDILPKRFAVFADLKTPYVPGVDTPFFWHIPRSGGVVVKTMLSHCLGQVLAAEVGELDGHENDSELKVVSFSEHNYTNVNIATPDGITRALNLGLVPSHLSATLVSAHVDLIPSLFNANDRARAFVLFRHPVDRASSMFYFLKGTGYPPLKNMTVDDYAKSELIENNWLVRILSESMTGPIDMDNLEIAKEVIRRKFIVGLLDNKRGSFARFDHYFKWKESRNYEKEFGCRKQLMDEKYVPKHPIRKDSVTWKLLLEQNRFDVHLYDFARELFSQQSYIFGL